MVFKRWNMVGLLGFLTGISVQAQMPDGKIAGGFRIMETAVVCKEYGTPERPEMRYLAWPSIGRRPNGDLVVVFSGDRAAHSCPFGKNQMIVSRDNGRTWSAPATLNDSPFDDRDTGLCLLKNGTMLISWFASDFAKYEKAVRTWPAAGNERVDGWRAIQPKTTEEDRKKWLSAGGAPGSWLRRSTDAGKTWGEPIRLPLLAVPHGPVQLKDGRLLYLGLGVDESGRRQLRAAESTDGGMNWFTTGTVPAGREPPDTGEEAHLVECSDGTLVGMTRYNPRHDVTDYQLLQTESRDGGKTWTACHRIPLWGGPPHLIRLSSGYLLLTYGYRRSPFGQRACLSRDNGKTWDADNEIILRDDAINADLGYPASVELADGTIYTVYYQIDHPGEKPCIMGTHWRLPAMYTADGRRTANEYLRGTARDIPLGPRIEARVITGRDARGRERTVGYVRGTDLAQQAGHPVNTTNPDVPEDSWTFGSRMVMEEGIMELPLSPRKVRVMNAVGETIPQKRNNIAGPFSREPVYVVSDDLSAAEMEKAMRRSSVLGVSLAEAQGYFGNLDGSTGLVVEAKRHIGSGAPVRITGRITGPGESAGFKTDNVCMEITGSQMRQAVIPLVRMTPVDGENRIIHYAVTAGEESPCITGRTMVASAIRVPSPPAMDGSTDAWRNIPATVIPGTTLVSSKKIWRGPDDLSARLKLAWDEQALYFLIEVRDDIYLQPADSDYFYASDSAELCFNRARAGRNPKPFAPPDILAFALAPKSPSRGAAQWGDVRKSGATMSMVARLTDGGYALEGAIPWKDNFRDLRPQAGLAIPFDLKVNDRDQEKPGKRAAWDTAYSQQLVWCSRHGNITSDASEYGAIVLENGR